MAKLYIVIRVAGLIGGTVGPLPYDQAECERRIAEFNAKAEGHAAFTCEFHTERPKLEIKQ
jgi:hypothetical protein